MPDRDYLDDLVASVNGRPAESPDAVEALPEPVESAEPPGVASQHSSPGAAGGPQDPRPELLEVPEEIRARPEQSAAPAIGGTVGQGPAAASGRAVGPVAGRMMAVMPEQGGEGVEAIAGILGTIALVGLPAKGAVVTKAVGSKI